ncbi:Ent-kaurene oxidase [Termitomyces sp. J132]|nr:Ent-kaurene oxidase [Termitomyces sp. J132]
MARVHWLQSYLRPFVLMDTEGDEVSHVAVIVPLLVVVLLAILVRRQLRKPNYNHIPTAGPSIFPFSYIGAFKFLLDSPRQLQDGFKKLPSYHTQHGRSAFKVADFARWNVVVTGAQLIEELRIAQKDEIAPMNTHDCTGLTTIDHGLLSVLGTKLTRNLPVVISEMRDEVVVALADVASCSSGWTAVLVADALTEVVSRVCNRAIVGPQLCAYTFFYRSGHDLLSFLISKPNTNPYEITNALLTLNLQAIPSCTLNLTNALYHLSACPKPTIQTLRKEIEEALRPDGWTTHALDRMVNLDSFIKETMRLNTLDALTTRRIAVVPHTFSDGTYIPQGTHLGLACTPTHLDASRYTSPTTFDAFRFGSGPRYELTTAAPEFLAWGLGRGACPGRFFAGAVMKLVLAHVVLLYDVREEDRQVPKTRWVGARGVPDLNRKVLLKKR